MEFPVTPVTAVTEEILSFCSGFSKKKYHTISPRKIAILEQNQRRTRKIPSHTAPRVRCPPYCRLWAGVWPRRAEVGYGYHPACLGACRGAFRCAEKAAAGYEFVKGKTGDLALSLLDKNAPPWRKVKVKWACFANP